MSDYASSSDTLLDEDSGDNNDDEDEDTETEQNDSENEIDDITFGHFD